MTERKISEVVVHPIVLLSIVDHYNRISKGSTKRAVGVLLGLPLLTLGDYQAGGRADVSNVYAVPFEEDPKDPKVWYMDHIYHETMFSMFKKVFPRSS